DVAFTNNIVRHVTAGVNMHGRDDNYPSRQTKRILIKNNFFEDVGGARWGGEEYRRGTLFQIVSGTADIVIDHNTALQTGKIIIAEGSPHSGFVYQNNVTLHNHEGVLGAGTGTGIPTLKAYFPGAVVRRNVIVGGDRARYPRDNFFPASLAKVGFVDPVAGKFFFADSSPYRRAGTERKDPGVDFTKLNFPGGVL
ncbi:MAG: hypothetical protein HYV04_07650, partial [Deltaproteobacteria bacterium]|nr:hypothetical protein [Deltaproteobacteria bacterium]